jgi:membrane protein
LDRIIPYIKDKTHTIGVILWQSVKSFSNNGNSPVAASLAHYAFFAIIPMILLLFFALSLFITSSRAVMNTITIQINQMIPYYADTILKEVYILVKNKGLWGIISVAMLIWAAMPLAGTLRNAFFKIFKVGERHSFLKTRLLDAGVILLTILLFIVASIVNVTLKKIDIFKEIPFFYTIVLYLVTVGIAVIFYLVFVPVRVSFPHILAGAITTTVLWAIIRPALGLLLTYNPQYGIAFGSLKTLFIIILWIYYSFTALLFGTEIIANLKMRAEQKKFSNRIKDKINFWSKT